MLISAVTAVLLGAGNRPAAAQSSDDNFRSVEHWLPDEFEIACGKKDGPFRPDPRDTSCIGYSARLDYENNAWSAARAYQAAGFASPYNFGPVIDAYEGEGDSIRVFTDIPSHVVKTNEDGTRTRVRNSVLAHISPRASPRSGHWCSREGYRVMAVNPSALSRYPTYAVGLVAAHELFHAVQAAIPGRMKHNKHRSGKCYQPKWIGESQADAAAIDFTRRYFPHSFPPRPGNTFADNMAGLRPYNKPLNYKHVRTDYDTNSFWLYIGDRFHNLRFKYLENYMKYRAPTYGDGKEDWLRWLDRRLETDPKIKTPLYLFYPGFLTYFAGEWDGGVGRHFGSTKWLTRAFGGCQSVKVSPSAPYKDVDVRLHKVAGKCLSVTVTGLGASDLASVKIGALGIVHRRDIVDSLHLGFAFTDDQSGFNCAKLMRRARPGSGRTGCLFEPVTGTIVTGANAIHSARMWHASTLERGPGAKTQSKGGAAGDIENVYVLSYVPRQPWEEKLEGKPPITVKIAVGLETSTLAVEGSRVGRGSADGTRRTTRRRTVAAMGLHPIETDMTVPPSTGWIDHQGMDAIMGKELWDIIGEARTEGADIPRDLGGRMGGKDFVVFRLAEATITPLGGAPIEERVEVLREIGVMTPEPLPEGATGTFPASLGGEDKARHLGYMSEQPGDATLTIEENSHGAFRASVEGDVCVFATTALGATAGAGGAPNLCPRKIHVSGSISKPFAYLYRPATQLVSEETEGEKLYNEFGPPRLMREMFDDGGGRGAGAGGGAAGGGAGAVAAGTADCFCTCPERALPDTLECRLQCQPQWAICEGAAAAPAPEPAQQPQPPKPTVEAQVKYLRRLIGREGLAPEVEEMLVEDFATMSDETRTYLLRRYRDGVE